MNDRALFFIWLFSFVITYGLWRYLWIKSKEDYRFPSGRQLTLIVLASTMSFVTGAITLSAFLAATYE